MSPTLRAFTHYASDGTAIEHEILSVRCEARRANVGWEWACYATLVRCKVASCPACPSGHFIMRDRGESRTRGRALAAIASRVDGNFGRAGIEAATVKVLPTERARSGRVRPLRELTATL